MLIKLLIFHQIISSSFSATMPNLVKNGDFETLISFGGKSFCDVPKNLGFTLEGNLQDWNTSNIYNPCFNQNMNDWRSKNEVGLNNLPDFGVEKNSIGKQSAKHFDSYALLLDVFNDTFNKQNPYTNSRSSLVGHLSKKLIKNAQYEVQFYANLPEMVQSASRLGLYFLTTDEYEWAGPRIIQRMDRQMVGSTVQDISNLTVRLGAISPEPITDKINWIKVEGKYIGQGVEDRVLIGNLTDDQNKQIYIPMDKNDPEYYITPENASSNQRQFNFHKTLYSSYYIDHISVSCADSAVDLKGTPSPLMINRCDFNANQFLLNAKADQKYGLDSLKWNPSLNSWQPIQQNLNQDTKKTKWTMAELGINLNDSNSVGIYKLKSTYANCTDKTMEEEKLITVIEKDISQVDFSINHLLQKRTEINLCSEKITIVPITSSDVISVQFTVIDHEKPNLPVTLNTTQINSYPWHAGQYTIKMEAIPTCSRQPMIITKELKLTRDFQIHTNLKNKEILKMDNEFFEDLSTGVQSREWSIKEKNAPNGSMAEFYFEPSFHHQLINNGKYDVTLQINGENECKNSKTAVISVNGSPKLEEMPNSFSPNNDQINDVFIPQCIYCNFDLTITDSYGGQILKSHNEGWDGKINGADAPIGSYLYQIKIMDKVHTGGKTIFGTVTLIR